MNNPSEMAMELIRDVIVNTKTVKSEGEDLVLKWVKVKEVLNNPHLKQPLQLFKVESSTPYGTKMIPITEARFISKHLGIKFILDQEEPKKEEVPGERENG